MSYRRYFKIAKLMHTGRLKIPTTRQTVFSIPDWNANPPASPMTLAALPAMSHLS